MHRSPRSSGSVVVITVKSGTVCPYADSDETAVCRGSGHHASTSGLLEGRAVVAVWGVSTSRCPRLSADTTRVFPRDASTGGGGKWSVPGARWWSEVWLREQVSVLLCSLWYLMRDLLQRACLSVHVGWGVCANARAQISLSLSLSLSLLLAVARLDSGAHTGAALIHGPHAQATAIHGHFVYR